MRARGQMNSTDGVTMSAEMLGGWMGFVRRLGEYGLTDYFCCSAQ